MKHCFESIISIQSRDEHIQWRGRNAIIMIIALIVATIASIPLYLIINMPFISSLLACSAMSALAIMLIAIIRSGRVTLGTVSLLILQIGIMLTSIFYIQESQSTFYLLTMPVLFASLTLRPIHVWLVCAMVIIGTVLVITTSPLYSIQDNTIIVNLTTQAILAVSVAAIGFMTSVSTHASLKKARYNVDEAERGARALEANKQELERMVDQRKNELTESMVRLEDHEQRLKAGLAELQASHYALQELGIPILPVMQGVILAIIVGTIHEQQIDMLTQNVLQSIKQNRIQTVICDLTAVPSVPSSIAQQLMQLVQSTQLLGANMIFVGIRPELAEMLVRQDLDVNALIIFSNLQNAILSLLSDTALNETRNTSMRSFSGA